VQRNPIAVKAVLQQYASEFHLTFLGLSSALLILFIFKKR